MKTISTLICTLIAILTPALAFCQNQPPVAGPGGPYSCIIGTGITLDASGSYDTDQSSGDQIIKYEWDLNGDGTWEIVNGGPTANLSWAVLNAYLNGQYPASPLTGLPHLNLTLRVTDTYGQTSTAATTLAVYSNCPVACATISPNPCTNRAVSLDASLSYASSPFSSITSYAWKIYSGGTVIDTRSGIKTSYWFPMTGGNYTVELSVTDSFGVVSTVSQNVSIGTVTHAPVGGPAGPYNICVGEGLTLDASTSYDPYAPSGDRVVKYEWDINNDGVYDFTSANPIYNLTWAMLSPKISGLYPADALTGLPRINIKLRTTDTYGNTDVAGTYLTVYATNPTSVINLVPNPVILGSSVTLDGSRSYDSRPGGQLYFNKWVITKNSATVNTFTGPVVSWTPTSTGTYNITYTIYSGSGYTDKASANLTVTACPWYLAGDINMDCTADFSDFAILAQNWLTICQPSTSNPACTSR